jgi:hypothetical protein
MKRIYCDLKWNTQSNYSTSTFISFLRRLLGLTFRLADDERYLFRSINKIPDFGSSLSFVEIFAFYRVVILESNYVSRLCLSHGNSISSCSEKHFGRNSHNTDLWFHTGFFFRLCDWCHTQTNWKSCQLKCHAICWIGVELFSDSCELLAIQHNFFSTAYEQALLSSRAELGLQRTALFFCKDTTRLFIACKSRSHDFFFCCVSNMKRTVRWELKKTGA